MKERGMLHITAQNMSRAPAMRLMLYNTRRAMEELSIIGDFIEKALQD
ncbi:hypothetical protein [Bradyrhizobium cosmicum]|nr:hypothetical protein [Bradyrhizobium cosmicum]